MAMEWDSIYDGSATHNHTHTHTAQREGDLQQAANE